MTGPGLAKCWPPFLEAIQNALGAGQDEYVRLQQENARLLRENGQLLDELHEIRSRLSEVP